MYYVLCIIKAYVGVGDEDFGGRCEGVEAPVVTGHVRLGM